VATTILAVLIFTILAVGCVLVVVGTVMKNKWGIIVTRISCPNCGNSLDHLQTPKTYDVVLRHWITACSGKQFPGVDTKDMRSTRLRHITSREPPTKSSCR
jgi:hypothetical protein